MNIVKIQNYTFDSIGFVLYFHVLIMLMCHLQYLNFCYNLKMMYRIILKYYKYISDSLHLLPILSTQCIYSFSHLFSKDSMLRIFIVFSTYTVYTLAIYFRRMSVFFLLLLLFWFRFIFLIIHLLPKQKLLIFTAFLFL